MPETEKTRSSHEESGAQIRRTSNSLAFADHLDHFLARWGYKRMKHLVEPGLYSIGSPTEDSSIFVTANYTLSFDALRSSLTGVNGYILVLDTAGVNVWCAAGKGTFGTDELVNRIEVTDLQNVVSHRKLILPQLGAPGVSAHEVKERTGFKALYGPVRTNDLPEYLQTGKATPEMRKVRFTLWDRLVVSPLELVHVLIPMLVVSIALYFIFGLMSSLGAISTFLAGVILFSVLLPWLPTEDFSTKGLILGGIAALPFALITFSNHPDSELWPRAGWALTYMLAMPPVTAFLALNFTGSTTFTSKTGVRHEIFRYIPVMAVMFGLSIILAASLIIDAYRGGV